MNRYNRTAHLYNRRYAEEQSLKITVAVELLKHGRNSLILDLGCGTGLLIARIGKTAKYIVGLDISKSMLKEIELSVRHSRNVHLILADADQTPLRSNCFDTVFAITLLQNMPDPHRTLQEIKHVAKINAVIIVTGLKKRFTEHCFIRLLKSVKLRARLLKKDDALKCHIAAVKNKSVAVQSFHSE